MLRRMKRHLRPVASLSFPGLVTHNIGGVSWMTTPALVMLTSPLPSDHNY